MSTQNNKNSNNHSKKKSTPKSWIVVAVLLVFIVSVFYLIDYTFIQPSSGSKENQNSGQIQTETIDENSEKLSTESISFDSEMNSTQDTETSTETQSTQNTGYTITNTAIADLSSLSNELYNWGSGGGNDELNRPNGCLQYQSKFSAYPADFIIDTTEKVLYLTFDEGYEYGFTPKIIDTLVEKSCPAVFFITKPFAESEPELVQRMIDEGFMIGNHSVTHPADGLPSLTIDQQTNELMELDAYMKANYNYNMCLFRYPAGKFSEQSLALLNNLNYRAVFWSFAHMDYDTANQPDETASLQKMTNSLHPGAIYLLHGVSQTNANVLGSFIDQARAAGYTFSSYADLVNNN